MRSSNRVWRPGDVIDLNLPMPSAASSPITRWPPTADGVALERGPILYALEAADNGKVRNLVLPRDGEAHRRV